MTNSGLLSVGWYIVEGAVMRTKEMEEPVSVYPVTVNSVTTRKVTILTIR